MIQLLDLPEAIIILRPAPPPARVVIGMPLTYEEEVYVTCRPYNAAVGEVWAKCVAAARQAVDNNLEALACADIAVRRADLARQHLTLARLAGTAPWEGVPTVAIN